MGQLNVTCKLSFKLVPFTLCCVDTHMVIFVKVLVVFVSRTVPILMNMVSQLPSFHWSQPFAE